MNEKQLKLMKAAVARLTTYKKKVAELEKQLNSRKKFASYGQKGRKLADMVEELVEEVGVKLENAGVEDTAIEQVKDVVDTAVAAALDEATADLGEMGGDTDAVDPDMSVEEELIDEDTETELAELASGAEDEEVRTAALKFLKVSKDKKAFNKELLKLIKSAAVASYVPGGMVGKPVTNHKIAGTGIEAALSKLEKYALNS